MLRVPAALLRGGELQLLGSGKGPEGTFSQNLILKKDFPPASLISNSFERQERGTGHPKHHVQRGETEARPGRDHGAQNPHLFDLVHIPQRVPTVSQSPRWSPPSPGLYQGFSWSIALLCLSCIL